MEDLRSDLIKGSKGVVEEDEFYEKMEAPKFVDFTAPDRSRPDDRTWFCVRIGCDQQHEEVDPDALYKSFKLRVLAARSPNLRLQKSLNRRDGRSISKCPHSAPEKSAKDRISRLSAATTAMPGKRVNSKFRDHPISSLRSTPNHTNAKVRTLATEKALTTPRNKRVNSKFRDHPISSLRLTPNRTNVKVRTLVTEKALTTPRNKKCLTNQDPFRSVKHQKAPIVVPKNMSVAKALVFCTPKKASQSTTTNNTTTPVSEVCAEMTKLKITSLKKTAPRGILCTSSRSATQDPKSIVRSSRKVRDSVVASKKKNKDCSQKYNLSNLQKGVREDSSNEKVYVKLSVISASTTNVEEQLPSSLESNLKDSLQTETVNSAVISTSSTNEEEQLPSSLESNLKGSLQTETANSAASGNSEVQTLSCESAENCDGNKENISDIYKISSSSTCERSQIENGQNLPSQAARPPGKKFQENLLQGGKHKRTTNPKPFRLRTDERGVLKEANLERRHQLEVQKGIALPLRCGNGMQNGASTARAKLVKSAATKLVTNSQCQRSENSKRKLTEEPQQKFVKVASTRQIVKTRSVTTMKKVTSSQLQRNNTSKANTLLQGKKAVTISKEPTFIKSIYQGVAQRGQR